MMPQSIKRTCVVAAAIQWSRRRQIAGLHTGSVRTVQGSDSRPEFARRQWVSGMRSPIIHWHPYGCPNCRDRYRCLIGPIHVGRLSPTARFRRIRANSRALIVGPSVDPTAKATITSLAMNPSTDTPTTESTRSTNRLQAVERRLYWRTRQPVKVRSKLAAGRSGKATRIASVAMTRPSNALEAPTNATKRFELRSELSCSASRYLPRACIMRRTPAAANGPARITVGQGHARCGRSRPVTRC